MKKLCSLAIDFDTKRHEEIRKLRTGQDEGYTNGYLLNCD